MTYSGTGDKTAEIGPSTGESTKANLLVLNEARLNKAKRFAKQLLSDVIIALASVYCVYCCQNQTTLKNSYSALLLTAFSCGKQ